MSSGKILAVDDEPNIRHLIDSEFSLEGFEVVTAGSGEEGLRLFEDNRFDVVLLDLKLPKISGIETLRRIRQKSPRTAVIMITGYGDVKTAVETMKLGARDYISKPFKLDELLDLVKLSIGEVKRNESFKALPESLNLDQRCHFLECPSRAMQDIYALVKKIAPTDCTILLQGETGVGKDVLARQVHILSLRGGGPFVTLDCGLLPHSLAESELYGHRKGAFSGATEPKTGLVEKSHQGTLFLDEIGNIDLELQKKFLRFIETGYIRRVGENAEKKVNARIILATNLEIEEALQQGKIRSDLFYRMSQFHLNIPPLRDRPDDIIPLALHFLKPNSRKHRPVRFSDEASEIFSAYSWPGNIRELKATANRIGYLVDENVICPEHLPPHLFQANGICNAPRKLKDVEKDYIVRVLSQTGGNQSHAAKILGINRKTLYQKIKKYNIFS
jgi:DNA-binding NtrC family response regulator